MEAAGYYKTPILFNQTIRFHSRGTCFHHLQGRKASSILKMKASDFSETSTSFCLITPFHGGKTFCLHLQSKEVSSTLKMKATDYSEISVFFSELRCFMADESTAIIFSVNELFLYIGFCFRQTQQCTN
jgi:hypothetical protein